VSSWTRYFGCAVGFGFGVAWMTMGIASAILALLCAALGFGVAYIAERERASFKGLSRSSETPAVEDFVIDDFELEHFERQDEEILEEEPADEERVPVAVEADYGWPHG
jgi:hypothetical protein